MPPAFDGVAGDDPLLACQLRIGYLFRDQQLLVAALTHASGADHRLASNERLEFLGDSILGFVACEELFRRYPLQQEGELTKVKSSVVSRKTCAKVAKRLQLERYLILGKGMSGPQPLPASLHADVFEALIAAIYLDGGFEAAARFVRMHLAPEIDETVAGETAANYKSQLQQHTQRVHGRPPHYHLLEESGPDHSKTFRVAAQVGDITYAPAWGRNKKEAEQRAAGNALAEMQDLPPRYGNLDETPSGTSVTEPPSDSESLLADEALAEESLSLDGDALDRDTLDDEPRD
ncbi:MAG TPA: ribonuclease III [Pirellulaceae bacterium]|nr:ribonuclease III [Pirellulaceae bacterium]